MYMPLITSPPHHNTNVKTFHHYTHAVSGDLRHNLRRTEQAKAEEGESTREDCRKRAIRVDPSRDPNGGSVLVKLVRGTDVIWESEQESISHTGQTQPTEKNRFFRVFRGKFPEELPLPPRVRVVYLTERERRRGGKPRTEESVAAST